MEIVEQTAPNKLPDKTERNLLFLLIPDNRGVSHVTFGFLQFDWLEI